MCWIKKQVNRMISSNAKSPWNYQLWLTPQWKGVMDPTEEGADYDSFFKHAAERFSEAVQRS